MTKTSAFGLGFCLLSPSGHVFHTAWETMIESYSKDMGEVSQQQLTVEHNKTHIVYRYRLRYNTAR